MNIQNRLRRCFLLLALAPVLAILSATPALASRPIMIPVDLAYVHDLTSSRCGFPVLLQITGTLIIRQPAQGPLEVILGANFQSTWTNLETGHSVQSRQSGPEKLWDLEFDWETGILTLYYSMLGAERIVIPGGTAIVRSGKRFSRLVIDLNIGQAVEWDFVSVAGRGDDFEALLCSLLSP
jgi:hypothetical protein